MSTVESKGQQSMWVSGTVIMAAVLLVTAGLFQVFQGVAAIASDSVFVVVKDYTFKFDTTAWGWIHLVVGIIFLLVGFFLFTGNPFARGAGIAIAVVSAVVNFTWLPYFPLWAIIIIAIDILIIWALATYEPDSSIAGP